MSVVKGPNKEGADFYEKARVVPAKWLMPDGSIVDEFPVAGSGSGADLEDNKEVTIDVSSYTEPVEITPTAGKDGIKKATVTLSNIPSGGVTNLYAWINTTSFTRERIVYTLTEAPQAGDVCYDSYECGLVKTTIYDVEEEGSIIVDVSDHDTFNRNSSMDVDFTS